MITHRQTAGRRDTSLTCFFLIDSQLTDMTTDRQAIGQIIEKKTVENSPTLADSRRNHKFLVNDQPVHF